MKASVKQPWPLILLSTPTMFLKMLKKLSVIQSGWRQWKKKSQFLIEMRHMWNVNYLKVRRLGCWWVYSIKYHSDGTIEWYKAKLVAQGYTQTYGVDYSKTFSPVAKIDTIRVLFSIAANKDWPLHQFDVMIVFLHGKIEEEVYMNAPPSFQMITNLEKDAIRARLSMAWNKLQEQGLRDSLHLWRSLAPKK